MTSTKYEYFEKTYNQLKSMYHDITNKWKLNEDCGENEEYYVDFIRFEYVRRNGDYIKEWEQLSKEACVSVTDEGQAIPKEGSIKEGIPKIKEFVERWDILYACKPDQFLPRIVTRIYDGLLHIKNMKVVIRDNEDQGKTIQTYEWSETVNLWTNMLLGKSEGRKFALCYKKACTKIIDLTKKNNSTYLEDYLLDADYALSVHLFDKERNKNNYPDMLIFTGTKEEIDLTPYNNHRYSIEVDLKSDLEFKNETLDYVSSVPKALQIHPIMLKKLTPNETEEERKKSQLGLKTTFFTMKKSHADVYDVEWDSENWDLVAIRKTANQKEVIQQLKELGMLPGSQNDRKSRKPIPFESHIRRLIAWDLHEKKCPLGKISVLFGPTNAQYKGQPIETSPSDSQISNLIAEARENIRGGYRSIV